MTSYLDTEESWIVSIASTSWLHSSTCTFPVSFRRPLLKRYFSKLVEFLVSMYLLVSISSQISKAFCKTRDPNSSSNSSSAGVESETRTAALALLHAERSSRQPRYSCPALDAPIFITKRQLLNRRVLQTNKILNKFGIELFWRDGSLLRIILICALFTLGISHLSLFHLT